MQSVSFSKIDQKTCAGYISNQDGIYGKAVESGVPGILSTPGTNDFPCHWTGTQTVRSDSLKLIKTSVIIDHYIKQVSSPTQIIGHCLAVAGMCESRRAGWVIWDPKKIQNSEKDDCAFLPAKTVTCIMTDQADHMQIVIKAILCSTSQRKYLTQDGRR